MQASWRGAAGAFLFTLLLAAAHPAGAGETAESPAATAGGDTNKVVVELFTSQACAACPAADALLAELAERKDIIALAFHVDYWNFMGWRDPFSRQAWTERQKAYGKMVARRYVYTPQMLIDGVDETVGSKRAVVETLIDKARRRDKIPVTIESAQVDMMRVQVPASATYGGEAATIWVAFYDREQMTRITAGENRGMELSNRNIVRAMSAVGTWQGEEVDVTVALAAIGAEGHDACAVLVQESGTGPILGAAEAPLPHAKR